MLDTRQTNLVNMTLRAGILGCLLSSSAMHAAGCRKDEILVAMDAKNLYCLSTADYKNSHGPEFAAQYCSTKKTIAADQSAIRNLNFAADVDRYEMFGDVALDQQAELKNKVMMAMVGQALSATGSLAQSAKSLNPYNVNNAARLLEEKGFANTQLIAALRAIAAVKGKPEMAAAYQQFASMAQTGLNGYSTGRGIAKDPSTAQLQFLAGALKTMQGNYELGLVITGAEFAESVAYLCYVGAQVDDLTQVTDDKLARLTALGSRLKAHVHDLAAAQQAWQAETGVSIAPLCQR
jgi:hypothetical protein